jgi:hypothetical protein
VIRIGLAHLLLRAVDALVGCPTPPPTDAGAPRPLDIEPVPTVVPHAEAQGCPACGIAIEAIHNGIAACAYDNGSIRYAMRSLDLIGHGMRLDDCPYHHSPRTP